MVGHAVAPLAKAVSDASGNMSIVRMTFAPVDRRSAGPSSPYKDVMEKLPVV